MNEPWTGLGLILNRLDDLVRLVGGEKFSPWLTTVEAARYLRCSTSHIERLTRQALLPFKRQDPAASRSTRLYHRKDLVGFLVTGKNPTVHALTPLEKKEVEELLR